jgi:hypothetical protein
MKRGETAKAKGQKRSSLNWVKSLVMDREQRNDLTGEGKQKW